MDLHFFLVCKLWLLLLFCKYSIKTHILDSIFMLTFLQDVLKSEIKTKPKKGKNIHKTKKRKRKKGIKIQQQ